MPRAPSTACARNPTSRKRRNMSKGRAPRPCPGEGEARPPRCQSPIQLDAGASGSNSALPMHLPQAKLDSVLDRFHQVEARMGAVSDGAEIVRLSKEHAELKPVADAVEA